jgi:hypothetical protein
MTYTHARLKALAKTLGRPLNSLHALSAGNDPFLAEMPGREEAAAWFAACWQQFADAESLPHIRRIHYRLVSSTSPIPRPNGQPYENTEACWDTLCNAGRDARYLGLIPPGSIIDRRNPAPMIYMVGAEPGGVSLSGGLSEIEPLTLEEPGLQLRAPTARHRYLVEIWCEKSTVNEILMPLGSRYGLNIVTGTGELSATRCEQMMERARIDGRAVRILYVSDFDPSGENMPVSVARKLEYEIQRGQEDVDLQVRHVTLTYDQCIAYRLPRTPIKETERRAGKWETRYGEGATELDALEAIRPGELRRMLVEEIERYRDPDLADRIEERAEEIQDELDVISAEVRERHAEALAAVERERLELVAAVEAFQERAGPVLEAVDADLSAEAPDVEDYDWPEPAEGDEDDDPLFDSNRDYFEQIDRYRVHQGKPEDAEFKTYELTCEVCGETFESRRPQATTCSKKCRAQKYRDGQKAAAVPAPAQRKMAGASRTPKVSRPNPKRERKK